MKILDRLPISEERASLRFDGRFITVHRNQILVWLSVHLRGVLEPEANIPRFPALLDAGNNFGFSVRHRHLREWAGIDPGLLDPLPAVQIDGQVVGCREATVWLCPKNPGRPEVAGSKPPLRLRMPSGIAVYAQDADPPGPRLPLLGLPALLDNDLDFWLDPDRRQITVQSRTWRRSLMRLVGRL
jgi:hypothetical protein